MRLDLTGLKNDITPAIQEFTEKKIEKLNKFFDRDTLVHVTFEAKKERHYVDIRVEDKGKTYIAEENTNDLYDGIEESIEKLIRQVRKQKTKVLKKRTEIDPSSVIDLEEERKLEKEDE